VFIVSPDIRGDTIKEILNFVEKERLLHHLIFYTKKRLLHHLIYHLHLLFVPVVCVLYNIAKTVRFLFGMISSFV